LLISDKRSLGRTGLEVTIASYGGGSLGNFYRTISNAGALSVLEAAWAAGIRYFDTAPFYGRGRSERRLGSFLSERSREEFVLSTKVGRLLEPARGDIENDGIFYDPSPFNPHWDYSYDGIMRSYEMSLHRLGVREVDILYVHDIGKLLHGDDADFQLRTLKGGGLKALEELRASGEIKGYGLGVTEVEACLDCLDYGDPDAFLLAARYTLLEQRAAQPLLDRCLERTVSLVIGGVFASGILATGAVPGARYFYSPASQEILNHVRRLEAVCARYDIPLSAAALQFPLMHPAVTTVLLGAGTTASLESCITGLSLVIPPAFWKELIEEKLLDSLPG
jgi:D-threo-aldose 1-dehydrogenase